MVGRSAGEHDWRHAVDWHAMLAGVLINDEWSKIRFATHLRSGVRQHLIRYLGKRKGAGSVEKCIQALVDEVQRDAIQHVELLPKLLLRIVRAEVQAHNPVAAANPVVHHVSGSATS